MSNRLPVSVSLFGPDGCGKSAIAESMCATLASKEQGPMIIGGSSYKSWLTDDVARRFTGNTLDGFAGTQLYERITMACYGFAAEQRNSDRAVIIDSDPYLKRMVWAKTEMSTDQYQDYVMGLEERITAAIGEVCGPSSLAIIELSGNIQGDSRTRAAEITHSRIHQRQVVTDFDPTTLEENLQIHDATRHVIDSVITPRAFPRIPVDQQVVVNGQCEADQINGRLSVLADQILSTIGV